MTDRKQKLTPKEKAFAHNFVETLNGTESARRVYDVSSDKSAGVIASQNLGKLRVREEIAHLMERNGVNIDDVLNIHKRNMLQADNLPVSQKAVADFYTILGVAEQKTESKVAIAFVLEEK